jgi:hypothetical protein
MLKKTQLGCLALPCLTLLYLALPYLALPCNLEDRENIGFGQMQGFTIDWIYGTSCTLTSFPALDSLSERYNRSIFVA